ncbi:palmitoyltransferase ZDHHC1 [Gadus chalcogrammus]|uniref:palmitoyltransferase ZDHHC1 n=1 Tax=Gadus chalcogrammus TaxID=1042646 RepID=UPI0024C484A7|nr:palmitoyltransferase ZDHHC1 [Gadus chalcogrammus]
MDVCSRNPNRTSPVSEAGGGDQVPLCSRTNGWSWPPHPLQLLAWLLYLFFAITSLGIFIPLLPPHWLPAGYICTGIMLVGHLCVHVMAVSLDPADQNVRRKTTSGPVPVFDRSRHAHVIENCHCYLCQVDVGPKSKHCSSCNKCVASFDHHCRWLNNCVGRRNYKLFLNSVISALLGICLVLVSATYVFIQFLLDPSQLRTDTHFQVTNDTGLWFVFLPLAPVDSAGAVIPVLAAVTIGLGLLSCTLLSHLLGFHMYLMWNRLSTYEYIVKQRHRQGTRGASAKTPTRKASANIIQELSYSGTLGYTNPEVDHPRTLAPPDSLQFHMNGEMKRISSGGEEDKTTSHTQRKKKKKRKVHRVPSETHTPPAELCGGPELPHAAFPLRPAPASRAPSLGPGPGPRAPLQAAGPPAEYHSDSAESLEEIPVPLARLGSCSSSGTRALPACTSYGPPLPRFTKRKRRSRDPRRETFPSEPPTVFVSQASGELGEPKGWLIQNSGRSSLA